jgi:hypothetical protein
VTAGVHTWPEVGMLLANRELLGFRASRCERGQRTPSANRSTNGSTQLFDCVVSGVYGGYRTVPGSLGTLRWDGTLVGHCRVLPGLPTPDARTVCRPGRSLDGAIPTMPQPCLPGFVRLNAALDCDPLARGVQSIAASVLGQRKHWSGATANTTMSGRPPVDFCTAPRYNGRAPHPD